MYGANDLTYNGNIANSSMKTFDVQCCALFSFCSSSPDLNWAFWLPVVRRQSARLSVTFLTFLFFIFPRTTYVVKLKKNKARRLHYLFEGELIWPHLFPKGNENALFTLILKIFQCIEPIFTRQGWQIPALRATLKRSAEWIVWRFVTKYIVFRAVARN